MLTSLAAENNILYLETSAKNASNVKNLFVEIAKKLPQQAMQQEREQVRKTYEQCKPAQKSATLTIARHARRGSPSRHRSRRRSRAVKMEVVGTGDFFVSGGLGLECSVAG